MNYVIMPDRIQFGVESKFSCKETSSRRYIETMESVFHDIRLLCESVNSVNSKL
jgi:hypothetical protein